MILHLVPDLFELLLRLSDLLLGLHDHLLGLILLLLDLLLGNACLLFVFCLNLFKLSGAFTQNVRDFVCSVVRYMVNHLACVLA